MSTASRRRIEVAGAVAVAGALVLSAGWDVARDRARSEPRVIIATVADAATVSSGVDPVVTWRRGAEVVHNGRLMHFAPLDEVYVYFRYTEKGAVLVALNLGAEGIPLDLERYSERLEGYHKGLNVLDGQQYTLADGLTVPGRGALVLELK